MSSSRTNTTSRDAPRAECAWSTAASSPASARYRELLLIATQLTARDIWANKLRFSITTFGIFLGVGSLVANLAFMRGIDADIGRNLALIGGVNLVRVTPSAASNDAQRRAFARSPGLTRLDADDLVRDVPLVRAQLPWARLHTPMRGRGPEQSLELLAATPRHAAAFDYQLAWGRWFTDAEDRMRQALCVVGAAAARRLFGAPEAARDGVVVVQQQPFAVIGVHTPDERSTRSREVLVPYTSFTAARQPAATQLEGFHLELRDTTRLAEAVGAITRRLAERHRGAHDFRVAANGSAYEEMQRTSSGLKGVLALIAAISLFVGMVSVMNIMFASIHDRVREIGVRRALGAERGDIFAQVLAEAVVTTTAGAMPALAVGLALTWAPAGTFPFAPRLHAGDYALALGFALVAGLLSGLLPALSAARLQPVEALRV